MKCPKCKINLKVDGVDGYDAFRCASCSGLWINGKEMLKILRSESSMVLLYGPKVKKHVFKSKIFKCPSCDEGRLETRKVRHIDIEICDSCRGAFFDDGELVKVVPKLDRKPSNENTDETHRVMINAALMTMLIH